MSDTRTVRLDQLEHDPVATEGRGDRLKQIDDLLASIPALGQLQSLRVRPWTGGDRNGRVPDFGVVAGNRRLATLRKLAATGAEIHGVKVGPDYPVHVIFGDDDDAVAFAGTVAENVQRVPETPMGEARAYGKMARDLTVKQIAATFGVTEKRVRQRLALAGLHPDVQAAVESGKLSLDAAEAFTLAEPDRQAAYLKKAAHWQLQAHSVRNAFTEKLINGSAPVARLIGLDAYRKAGGKVLGDVFTDTAYWISTGLIDTLLAAHWVAEAAKWQAEGWSFVESADQFCEGDKWTLRNQHEHLDAAGEGKKGAATFTAEQKAISGVVYFPDGSEAPHFGVMRGRKRAAKSSAPEADLNSPPGDLPGILAKEVTTAWSLAMRTNPLAALRLLIACLMENGDPYDGVLELVREFEIDPPDDVNEEEPERSLDECLARTEGWTLEEIAIELARILAQGLNGRALNGRRPGGGPSASITALLKPAFVFEANGYFKGLTKPYLDLVWRDMTDPAAGEKLLKGKVEDLQRKVSERAADTGWLPPQLRTPSYTGPHFLDAAGKAKPDADEAEEQLQAAE